MLDFSNTIIQITVYAGLLLVFAGVFGNIFNIIVFYKNSFRSPSGFILFCQSWVSLGYVVLGLLSRVIAGGFLIDWTTMNMHWCRARFYIGHVNLFVSISYMCYAIIDQFFQTSQQERLRRLSTLKRVRFATASILLFWLLHSLPVPILAQQVPTASGGLVCNTLVNIYLKQYISYFLFPVLSATIPVILLTIIGSLTYRNVSRLQNENVRQRAQRHLTSMVLLQTVSLIVGAVPYGSYYVYSAITSSTAKDADRLAIENLIFQIVNVFYYFPQASTFYIYFISSETFRNQVKTTLCRCARPSRVEPSQTMAIRLNILATKVKPTQTVE